MGGGKKIFSNSDKPFGQASASSPHLFAFLNAFKIKKPPVFLLKAFAPYWACPPGRPAAASPSHLLGAASGFKPRTICFSDVFKIKKA